MAPGYPNVDYKPCCDGSTAVDKAGDWGKFCPDTDLCYKEGERNQGAAGYPEVQYRPCCDGKVAVEKDGDWGKFCPGEVVVIIDEYIPILCESVGECSCPAAGEAQCSKCPDDGGSPNVDNDVCWCSDVPSKESRVECNPLKINGPANSGCRRRRRRL